MSHVRQRNDNGGKEEPPSRQIQSDKKNQALPQLAMGHFPQRQTPQDMRVMHQKGPASGAIIPQETR